jgi:DNA-dependent protein kinase catalytic subunit
VAQAGDGGADGGGGGGGRGSTAARSQAADAAVKYALFCDQRLRESEAEAEEAGGAGAGGAGAGSEAERAELAAQTVHHLLRAMVYGHPTAADRLPRVIELASSSLARDGLAAGRFRKLAPRVPPSALLRWTAQLMAQMDKAGGPMVYECLLQRLADSCPRSLYYSFRISSEGLKPAAGSEAARCVDALRAKLEDPTMAAFVEALRRLHNPEIRWKECMIKVRGKLGEKTAAAEAEAVALFAQFWELCAQTSNVPHLGGGKALGTANDRFGRELTARGKKSYKWPADGALGGAEAKSGALGKAAVVEINAMQDDKAVTCKGGVKVNLSDFSGWLEGFGAAGADAHGELEVPGAADAAVAAGEAPPMVTGFGQKLLVMASKQKPKRLTVHTSDFKERNFLVKGGEDLRLDQRIEQLFAVMNQVFAVDGACRARGLRNRVYAVVPMTTDVGLLEWVDNTEPLKGMLESEMLADPRADNRHFVVDKRSGKKHCALMNSVGGGKAYKQWVTSFELPKSKNNWNTTYGALYSKGSAKDTVAAFRHAESLQVALLLLQFGVTCLPACLLACLSACLPACPPACLRACVPACLTRRVPPAEPGVAARAPAADGAARRELPHHARRVRAQVGGT